MAKLEALGAEVIEFPTIEIRPAEDYRQLDAALADLRAYDWLIFTSANGVRFFMERLELRDRDLKSFRGSVCAIGPATRKAVEKTRASSGSDAGGIRGREPGRRFCRS